jgi:transcriptional regulator with XRE-family HTH domain
MDMTWREKLNVRVARENRGLLQRELAADLLGLTQSPVSDIERGRNPPSPWRIGGMAATLGVPRKWFGSATITAT